ncbi:MAG TPA: FliA/WhiG family RNA polymerase sigma factor [Bryobacteraceae bacterium]|nr:FliA/WhiG family RNA polymerase sigma factor [Bryobacteraceae bacterium]
MTATRVPVRRPKMPLEVRDQIVLEHLPLVKAIAIRVRESLPVQVEVDDLVHAGVLGLFDAVVKYDETKNVAFHAYAKHRIKGAILDSLRQLDWASRDLRRRQKQVEALTRALTTKLGREPNEAEMAEGMGVTLERWRHMVAEMRTMGLVPVSTTPDPEHEPVPEIAARPESRPDRICEHRELRSTLARAIGTLPERYRKVVFLYYTNQMTMKEIGDAMGVNESRVSQIHKTALKKMAVVLESEGIRSAAAF